MSSPIIYYFCLKDSVVTVALGNGEGRPRVEFEGAVYHVH